MSTQFFDVDREMAWYKIDTPNNLHTGVQQIDTWKKTYYGKRHVPENRLHGIDKAHKKQTKTS